MMKVLPPLALSLVLALIPTAVVGVDDPLKDPETGLAAQCKAIREYGPEELALWLANHNEKSLPWARGVVATALETACGGLPVRTAP